MREMLAILKGMFSESPGERGAPVACGLLIASVPIAFFQIEAAIYLVLLSLWFVITTEVTTK